MTVLLTSDLLVEDDVALARKLTSDFAGALGFEPHDRARAAGAVSELGYAVLQHAGRGRVVLGFDESNVQRVLHAEITTVGAIADLESTDSGLPLARQLMDGLEVEAASGGTRVLMQKRLTGRAPLTPAEREAIAALVAQPRAARVTPRDEQRAYAKALVDLADSQRELEFLSRELDETNRGVMVLYNELEEKAEALRRSQSAKNQFFSEMNHEVRTPINSILNLAELLANGTLAKPLPEQETAIGYIRKAAQQLSELVDDLLDLSRSEAGKLVVRPSRFSVDTLFGGLRGMFRPLHTREGVRLIFGDTSSLPDLYTDEGKVSQILRNFISNALKFTERGSVTVEAALDGDHVVFTVRDTGIGIDPSQHETLFTPFTQIENPHQKRVKGTGLGLSLTRALSELLGGRVAVESELGRGSAFKAIIPRTCPSTRDVSGVTRSNIDAILIIDDDEIARYLLRGAIGPGYSFIEAGTGSEGLEAARKQRPRLIFLDLRMPNMDGFAVLDALKAEPSTREIPVVIHTSHRLQVWERERLAPLSLAIVQKDQLHQTPGRVGIAEILASAGIARSG